MLNLEWSGLLYIFKLSIAMKGIQNVKMQTQLNLMCSALKTTHSCWLWTTSEEL